MNQKRRPLISIISGLILAILILGAATVMAGPNAQAPTLISYQGFLTASNGDPMGNTVNLQFDLYNVESGGSALWTETQNSVAVTDGYFSVMLGDVTPIDADDFNGSERWLQVTVDGTAMPRQRFASVPYALQAENAATSASVPWSGISGIPAGFADGVDDVGTGSTGWALTGNSGTTASNVLGTTDAQTLTLVANNATVMRFVPSDDSTSPNIIGGYSGNSIANGVIGSVIGGGGGYFGFDLSNQITDSFSTIAGGNSNNVSNFGGTIGGGLGNIVGGNYGVIGGGSTNTIQDTYATIGGGINNDTLSYGGTIGGGSNNQVGSDTADNRYATVSGGENNTASGEHSAIAGGHTNVVTDTYGTIAGGYYNKVYEYGGFVGGGNANRVDVGGMYASIVGGMGSVAAGNYASIGGGGYNSASGDYAGIGGGQYNLASGDGSTIGGGIRNIASGTGATVSGGGFDVASRNTASGDYSAIGGGLSNTASGNYSTIPGGRGATATHYGETAHANGYFDTAGDAQASTYILRGTTTDAGGNYYLYLDGSSESITIPASRAMFFDIQVVAIERDNNYSAGYHFTGIIKRDFNNTTTFIGTPTQDTFEDFNSSAWNAEVTADDIAEALAIHVTGTSGQTIRWVATVRATEVAF